MNIIWNELKKIMTLKTIVLLFIVSVVFYQHFIMFDLEFFPNGRPTKDAFLVAREMVEQYGEYLDEEEFEHFKKVYEQKIEEATAYLQSQKDLVAAGLDTYEKFEKADLSDEKLARLHGKVLFEDEIDIFWELEAREYLIEEHYEHPERFGHGRSDGPLSDGELARVNNLLESGSATAILPWLVYENYNTLAGNVTKLLFLSVMIIITPLYLTDRKNKMIHLQYTTRAGRTVFFKKIIAALIATIVVITVQLVWFFYLYRGNDTAIFMPIEISSLFNSFISWYDLTFLQYIILTVISMYALGIVTLLLVALISSLAPNYMTNIGVQIPLAFVLFGIGTDYLVQNITNIFLPKHLLPIALVVILVGSTSIFVLKLKKEGVRDIV